MGKEWCSLIRSETQGEMNMKWMQQQAVNCRAGQAVALTERGLLNGKLNLGCLAWVVQNVFPAWTFPIYHYFVHVHWNTVLPPPMVVVEPRTLSPGPLFDEDFSCPYGCHRQRPANAGWDDRSHVDVSGTRRAVAECFHHWYICQVKSRRYLRGKRPVPTAPYLPLSVPGGFSGLLFKLLT